VRIRRSNIYWLVAVGVAACTMTVSALPAQAYTAEISPGTICAFERSSNEIVEQHSKLLGPANGATVAAGTAVAFSAESGFESPMTFTVASSPALLSSPDIAGGPGVPQPLSQYTFTSTEAAVTPRTIYWTASFTRTLKDCEEPPVTFTLPPRMFTVLPSPAEEQAAANRKQEEAAAKKKQEEAAAVVTGSVYLASTHVTTSSGDAAVKLACTGTGTCIGKLTLTAKRRGKGKKTKIETIGTATVSIPAGKPATIELELNADGRTLLNLDHGRLSASLTLLKSSPAPSQTHIESVRLVQQKAQGKTRK
jgi:hypothetical protein